ncbi:MAG TPA: hypothetical protein PK765_02355 [bacterium]|nr:hypothetical protein [bacterium]
MTECGSYFFLLSMTEKLKAPAGAPEVVKPTYPLNFDFQGMSSTDGAEAQKQVSVTGNILKLGNQRVSLDANTRDVQVSLYMSQNGQKFLQVTVNNLDNTAEKVWLNQYGQMLQHEPKNGISGQDMIRMLAPK